MARIDDPEKRGSSRPRRRGAQALGHLISQAYDETIRHTATKDAPWYVVPADHKWFTRLVVAATLVERLEALDLKFPKLDEASLAELEKIRAELIAGAPPAKDKS